ncbi:unnamed protein product [Staurois parvus]|uniref:Uncharacterized protein n=1 Tax=Staurois parvus TaxID=386267 RepID=A0ABN9AX20_9NEOB|nr:unnamed protein product [Staurois parvus]
MGLLCPCPKLKKAYEKGTRGISWGPLLTLGPRAVPEFPNGQSTPRLFLELMSHVCWATITLIHAVLTQALMNGDKGE